MGAESSRASALESESQRPAREIVIGQAANEFVFAVVGHVGSGTSTVAKQLEARLREAERGTFDVEIVKASDLITAWATEIGAAPPARQQGLVEDVHRLQDLGDRCRRETQDASAVAVRAIHAIRAGRARKQGVTVEQREPVPPDGARRAWIVDSLRHPAEAELLRHVYQDAFVLIGVVCDDERRSARLRKKYHRDGSPDRIEKFMERDAEDADKRHGQRVADTFHMSDFFVDNTEDRTHPGGAANERWDVAEQLSRLIKIVTHDDIVRPTPAETAMHAAYGAQLRSACLSRQVGAALVSGDFAEVLATGTNEVPRAGGGVYGREFDDAAEDHRCAFRANAEHRFCSNTRQQLAMVDELIERIEQSLKASGSTLPADVKLSLRNDIRRTRVGSLIEFSRAVHAEMDALLSAGRHGISTVGARLFVTTFPCHYCARHIVSAGVIEVQYIEPYPKSLALRLHHDAIATSVSEVGDAGPRKVLFRPFTGAAPRLYRRAFLKDRDLKDDAGMKRVGQPEWGTPWHLRRLSYVHLETELLPKGADESGRGGAGA